MFTQEVSKLIQQANFMLAQKNYAQAKRLLQEALELDIQHVQAMSLLALAELNSGNYTAGMTIIDNALRIDPTYHFLLYLKAFGYHYQKMHIQALKYAEQAVANSPLNVHYLIILAICQMSTEGQRAVAEQTILRALDVSPTNAEALRIKSLLSTASGNYDLANIEIEKSLSLNPEHAFSYMGKAVVLLMENEVDKAIGFLLEGMRLEPQNQHLKTMYYDALKYKVPVIGPMLKDGLRSKHWPISTRRWILLVWSIPAAALMVMLNCSTLLDAPVWNKFVNEHGLVISVLGVLGTVVLLSIATAGLYIAWCVLLVVVYNIRALFVPSLRHLMSPVHKKEYQWSIGVVGLAMVTALVGLVVHPTLRLHIAVLNLFAIPVAVSIIHAYLFKDAIVKVNLPVIAVCIIIGVCCYLMLGLLPAATVLLAAYFYGYNGALRDWK